MGATVFPTSAATASKRPGKSTRKSSKIVDQSMEKVRHVLETRRRALVAMAERLIEKETIDTDELKQN